MAYATLSDAQLRETLAAWRAHDCNAVKAAAALGVNYETFKSRIKNAKARGLHLSEGAQRVVSRAQLSGAEAKGGWIHDYDSDGKKIGTTRWAAEDVLFTDDLLDRIKGAFEGMTPAALVPPPSDTMDDLCNVLPMYDAHLGMAAWARETGDQDYDLNLARDDMVQGLERVLSVAPRADTCILLFGGDLLHANGNSAQTPKSKHVLDVAGRMWEVTETVISLIKYAVHRALEHHARVEIKVLRGNHDEDSHRVISFSLAEWARENPRVEVLMDPREIYMRRWGRAAIFGQHGDRMKPVDLALKLSDVCEFWSACPHRYAYTGHKHSMAAERIGGLSWERLEPFAPADAYGSTWVNRRAMKIDTYHNVRGRIATAIDPLERT